MARVGTGLDPAALGVEHGLEAGGADPMWVSARLGRHDHDVECERAWTRTV
jgi:hypothetical protein